MIIFCNKPGRLGNLLILLSHFFCLNKEYKIHISILSFYSYHSLFSNMKNNFTLSIPPSFIHMKPFLSPLFYYFFYYLARVIDKLKISNSFIKTIHLDWNQSIQLNSPEFINECNQTKILLLQGWLYRVSPDLFLKYKNDIIQFLSIHPSSFKNIQFPYNDIKKKHTLFGIHIRRGDYKRFENGRYYYSFEEYINLILHLQNNFKNLNPYFYICSDETLPHHLFNDSQINHYYLSTYNAIEDLYILSNTQYIVAPPSTFSLWAAFYGNVPIYLIYDTSCFPKSLDEFKPIDYL